MCGIARSRRLPGIADMSVDRGMIPHIYMCGIMPQVRVLGRSAAQLPSEPTRACTTQASGVDLAAERVQSPRFNVSQSTCARGTAGEGTAQGEARSRYRSRPARRPNPRVNRETSRRTALPPHGQIRGYPARARRGPPQPQCIPAPCEVPVWGSMIPRWTLPNGTGRLR